MKNAHHSSLGKCIKIAMRCTLSTVIGCNTKQKISAGEDAKKLEPFYIDSGNAKWCGYYKKQLVPYKLKHRVII